MSVIHLVLNLPKGGHVELALLVPHLDPMALEYVVEVAFLLGVNKDGIGLQSGHDQVSLNHEESALLREVLLVVHQYGESSDVVLVDVHFVLVRLEELPQVHVHDDELLVLFFLQEEVL